MTSSRSWKYEVFPSFNGENVRKKFLSYLIKELDQKSIITFKDNNIERSHEIGPVLLLAIRESRISIVVFSKNYASSTWCLNELVEIHRCYKEFGQMVIPIFYEVPPSDVRNQTGDFGKAFQETCEGKSEDEKLTWMRVLEEVANIAGEDSRNWDNEANMVNKITEDVLNKLITPSNDFGDYVGIEDHINRLNTMLCLESKEVKMIGIVGPSGIGKTTIARALFSRVSIQFHHRIFVDDYTRTTRDDNGTALSWERRFMSEILCQNNLRVEDLGVVKQRLKHMKVLIVLNDVDDIELLKTLVGKPEWFGPGSRIIVITQDWQILKSHGIELIYEVEFPSKDLALEMLCRSAFGENSPPDGFMELAVEVAELSGNLPLGLNVLGSSLRRMDKEEWMEILPRFRNGLCGKIENILRIGYDGLSHEDQELFLYIACIFNSGETVSRIKELHGDINFGLNILANKSLVRIPQSSQTVHMHSLLQKLGREIVRAESRAGSRGPVSPRFLVDADDIYDALTQNIETRNVLAKQINISEFDEPLAIDEKSFERMRKLKLLKIYKEWSPKTSETMLTSPRGLVSLPPKLRLLHWDECPLKCMPSSFTAKFLVELQMQDSKLEKLWKGTPPLQNLKEIHVCGSVYLKEIPDLSNATNLEILNFRDCTLLETLPSSIRNLKKLLGIWMGGTKLGVFPNELNFEALKYLYLDGCSQLTSFPRISKNITSLDLRGTTLEEEDCFWIENITSLTILDWHKCPMRCMPSKFCGENLVRLELVGSKLEKLWNGVKLLGDLRLLDLSRSEDLKEFPNLSEASGLLYACLNHCKSLVMVPSTIRYLNRLEDLCMRECTMLKVLPTDVNLLSLWKLDLSGCSQLTSFPQISMSIVYLHLDDTAIEEVPSWVENMSGLTKLTMSGCKKLKHISPNIFKLKHLEETDFLDYERRCETLSHPRMNHCSSDPTIALNFHNCVNMDYDARDLLVQSDFREVILPGREVPTYFTQQACGSSLTISLPQSSLSQDFLGFKACVVVETLTDYISSIAVCWYFRGKEGEHVFEVINHSRNIYNMFMFHIEFLPEELNDPPSESEYEDLKFEFFNLNYVTSNIGQQDRYEYRDTCPLSPQMIKGCGVRVLNVTPLLDTNDQPGE